MAETTDQGRLSLKTYTHPNGRRCIKFGTRWLHFDHPSPEPGPGVKVDYECRMDHLISKTRDGSLFMDEAVSDKQAFGFPGVGSSFADDASMTIPMPRVKTKVAARIISEHMPEALQHFLKRNAEYGEDNDFNLGVRGQYVDISRKVQKLKRRWWDNHDVAPGSESDKVVVMELIGHLLMAMDMMREEAEAANDTEWPDWPEGSDA